ncbi:MAG: hypothetical protein M1819_001630, partial [Sarea resinae]
MENGWLSIWQRTPERDQTGHYGCIQTLTQEPFRLHSSYVPNPQAGINLQLHDFIFHGVDPRSLLRDSITVPAATLNAYVEQAAIEAKYTTQGGGGLEWDRKYGLTALQPAIPPGLR